MWMRVDRQRDKSQFQSIYAKGLWLHQGVRTPWMVLGLCSHRQGRKSLEWK